ncbi:HAD family hydrolase [Chitinivibrio alkaliphilus]|uniref:Hydrolase n=1 Tax=Chitinivibrio alkaliphilus ACht1 TaxID=1313304 RepID=U7D5W9_9BACT|nr:HAD family hydrolase [Chitinivibrio alkaliphilus]ERP30966.1 hydrolase [Chitinivibrio alkaliphilus ACht1]
MSVVAEFAALLHRDYPSRARRTSSMEFQAKTERLGDIQAVIFDVYGTLVDYWQNAFNDEEEKGALLRSVFTQTSDFFHFTPFLEKINPSMSPGETLFDFYHNLIGMKHEEARKKGKDFPEIEIDEIWHVILSILENNGYVPTGYIEDLPRNEAARIVAYYYNFFALNRGFFPEVFATLQALRQDNISLGILSNAQFYTPIDMNHFLREQSNNTVVDLYELFDLDLCFYSYQYGIAKPGEFLYTRLLSALKSMEIAPSQTLFVGNDLELDMMSAREVGLRTAFFTGNKESTFLHGRGEEFVPDLSFSHFSQLPEKVSFHGV